MTVRHHAKAAIRKAKKPKGATVRHKAKAVHHKAAKKTHVVHVHATSTSAKHRVDLVP